MQIVGHQVKVYLDVQVLEYRRKSGIRFHSFEHETPQLLCIVAQLKDLHFMIADSEEGCEKLVVHKDR